LRSDTEKEIAREASQAKSLGADLDRIVTKLAEIGKIDGYTSNAPGGKFDEMCRHIRTRQIGQLLNERGGIDLMKAVAYRVRAALSAQARALEFAWAQIREWHP